MAKFVTFEPNDPQTRQNLTAVIKPYLERVQQLRGIEEFRIIFDDTTTTADLVERNTIYGKIHIKPTKTAEFILVDFILSRQGASFSE
jgi:phage tail sheath protein FI